MPAQPMSNQRASDRSVKNEAGLDRRTVLRGVAAMSAMPALATSAGTAAADSGPAGPTGVHVAYGRLPDAELTVGWTGTPAETAKVEYRLAGSINDNSPAPSTAPAAAAPVPGERTVAYTAELRGLKSNTTYEYRAVLDDRSSDWFTTSTAPEPDGRGNFTVTAVGDHGIFDPENPVQRVQDEDPEEVLTIADSTNSAFHLCVGDISYANGHPSTWERYFSTFEDFYASTPFMTVPGNHEAEPGTGFTQYDRRLNDLMPIADPGLPDIDAKQRWYDFQYENTIFIGLNTSADACWDASRGEELVPIDDPSCQTEQLPVDIPESQERTLEEPAEDHLSGEDQARYLEETLQAAENNDDITWKIVYFHGPMWTTSPDHPDRRDLRRVWGTYLHEYNVDLVMSGDNHVWERTKPIGANGVKAVGETGTTFLTNGTGGTSHYEFEDEEPFVARRTNDYFGITKLDVVPTLASEFGNEAPNKHKNEEAIVVQYLAYRSDEDQDNDEFPLDYGEDDDITPGAEQETVDEFAIVKDGDKPRQLEPGES